MKILIFKLFFSFYLIGASDTESLKILQPLGFFYLILQFPILFNLMPTSAINRSSPFSSWFIVRLGHQDNYGDPIDMFLHRGPILSAYGTFRHF